MRPRDRFRESQVSRMKRLRSERGAAAVEFALVLPVLVLVLLGIVEFGRAYNAQITVTSAAREGARVMAIQNNVTSAQTSVKAASPSLNPQLSNAQIVVSPSNCTSGNNATVTVSYRLDFLTGFMAEGVTLTGKGVMRCGG